ncbi:MAG TPA: hypothetical protein VF008_26500, partial [Niastella sp.]
PLINAASGAYVTDDMDGQIRGGNPDIGADEYSNATITRRPLTPEDVGPQWMNEVDDITDNGGIITAQYTNTSKPAENFPSLIDNNTATKYFISNRTSLWVQYRSTVPAIAVKYTITSANDVPTRDPRNWNLQGSNDSVSWVTLDTRTDETFETRLLIKTYTFENTTPYLYYRLNITANNGASGTQFAEWEIYQRTMQTLLVRLFFKTYLDGDCSKPPLAANMIE